MITEGNKYRAELLKIAGFSLMTPMGKIILNIPDNDFWSFNLGTVIFILIGFAFFFCGIMVLSRGIYMVDKKEVNK